GEAVDHAHQRVAGLLEHPRRIALFVSRDSAGACGIRRPAQAPKAWSRYADAPQPPTDPLSRVARRPWPIECADDRLRPPALRPCPSWSATARPGQLAAVAAPAAGAAGRTPAVGAAARPGSGPRLAAVPAAGVAAPGRRAQPGTLLS